MNLRVTMFLALSLVVVCPFGQTLAVPMWSGEQNIYLGPGCSSQNWPSPVPSMLDMDLNGDGIDDFYFEYMGPSMSGFFVDPLVAGNETVVRDNPLSPDSWPLSAGTHINETPDTPWDSSWSGNKEMMVTWMDIGGAGPWLGVTNGYLGVSFMANDGLHYGWMRITNPANCPGAIIHDWAYETQQGVGIIAGAVPEPTTWALFICGALCIFFVRRRNIQRYH